MEYMFHINFTLYRKLVFASNLY